MLSDKDQETKVVYLKEKKKETKSKNDELVKSTMDKIGWSNDEALKEMNRVKTELGIEFEEYDKYDFALVSKVEQKEKYDKIKTKIEKDKK